MTGTRRGPTLSPGVGERWGIVRHLILVKRGRHIDV
jgi:hypothetical protein